MPAVNGFETIGGSSFRVAGRFGWFFAHYNRLQMKGPPGNYSSFTWPSDRTLFDDTHKCQDGSRARRRSILSPHGGAFESDGVEKLHDDDGVDGLLVTPWASELASRG